MKYTIYISLLLAACWLTGTGQTSSGLLDAADLAFLKQLTADVLEDSKIQPGQSVSPDFGPNHTGGVLIRPGGRNNYPSFWIRDYALSLACGMISEADQLHMLQLTASTQCDQTWVTKNGSLVPFGAIADHVRIDDSKPIYFPGTYDYEEQGTEKWGKAPPYSDQFFFINMAYHYVHTTGEIAVLTEPVKGVRLMERLDRAFCVPPARQDNHLVYTTEEFRGVDFGFRDAQAITGDLCIASIFKYRAACEMTQLARMVCDAPKAAYYTEIAEKLKTAIPQTFRDERGLLRASTGLSSQPDVWSTALAVYYGILEGGDRLKACSALAEAYTAGTLAYKGNIRHILTTDDFSDSTAWECAMFPKNTYQNGAYWGTPTGWVCYAITQVDPAAARRLAKEYIDDLKANDYRKGGEYGAPWECFHPNGHTQNPVYLTTVTCPLIVFEQFDSKAR